MSTGMFPTRDRPGSRATARYRARKLDAVLSRVTGNTNTQVGNPARLMLVQVRPVPPVSEYDDWLAAHRSADPRAKATITGAKLRRCIVMLRSGSSKRDCGIAVGMSQGGLARWLSLLPEALSA